MRKQLVALKREMAALHEQARARLCTCGKTAGTQRLIYSYPRSCAEQRKLDAELEAKRDLCPAMHPDGDAEPLTFIISLSFCEDAACECHKAPDHKISRSDRDGCPTCNPDYFKGYVTVTQAAEPSPAPLAMSEPMPVPARDVVATMRPVATPRPALPAPAALYGLEAAYAPECLCGHPASGHEEFRLASTCLDCGRPAKEHKDDGVLRFGGPGPCQFKPHFAGCALVFTPGGPCRCKAYRPREAQCP